MKKLNSTDLEKIEGGVTQQGCLVAGIFGVFTGPVGFAATVVAAALAGCFDY